MKKLNWFDKFLFFLNSLFAAALLFAYLLPFIPPRSFALLSVFSLAVPLFIMINSIFLIYWLLKLKRQILLPLIVLLLGFNHLTSIYEFSSSEEIDDPATIKVLSYNARQFNQYSWSDIKDIPAKISSFLQDENPDVLGIQEYFTGELEVGESFPHKYIKLKENNAEFGLAILSKYPIVNSGSLDFPTSSNNNAIYADIVVEQDTVRFINVHLQSYSIKPEFDKLEQQEHSKRVFKGMGQTFVIQQEQMEIVLGLIEETPYRTVVLGDFNNTAYSYIYRELRSAGFNDAYKEEGNGFGRTFDFDYFPLRIDYIMPEESIEVVSFETMEIHYSDHFPVMARIKL